MLKTLFGDKHDLEPEQPLSPSSSGAANFRKDLCTFLYCFGGLQASYLVWGVIQEKMMSEVGNWNIIVILILINKIYLN